MKIFDFTEIETKSIDLRLRNYYLTLKLVAIVLIVFIFKFIIKYHYINYWPLFLLFYFSVILSFPIVKKFTNNLFWSLWFFYLSFNITITSMIFMSGGIRAPGNIWLSILPFSGASLLGKRGFYWGVFYALISFLILITLNAQGIEMYPFASTNDFQFEFRVNLIIFTFTAFFFTYYHVSSEDEYQLKINKEKEKNENLLRILFHDLANPVQTIRLLLKKIQNNRTPEDFPKIISQIDSTSLRVVEILESVKKIKAIEDRKITYDLKPIMLIDMFEKTKELFHEKLIQKKLAINIMNSSDDLTVILVDQIYFTNQVIGNIISNAIKFSDFESTIDVKWEKMANEIIITITDHGIGMPKEILDNLFNENKQISRKGTYGEVGTGYGMPLVKSFIEEFKGNISIVSLEKSVSNRNSGTIITIKLPAV